MSNEPVARVYCIRNKTNGFVYIGVTRRDIDKRFNDHMRKKHRRNRKENLFTSDIIKYGRDNFSIELVENIYDPSIIAEIEDYWVSKFDKTRLYNTSRSSYSMKFFECAIFKPWGKK